MKKNILLLAAVLSSAMLLFGQNTSGHELMGVSGNSETTVQSSDTLQVNATEQGGQTRSADSVKTFDASKRIETPVDYSKNPYWAPQDFGYIEANSSGN